MAENYIEIEEFESNFAQVPKTALKDSRVSLKAKGLYAYLFSLPRTWKVYRSELLNHLSDGKDSLNSAFKELESFGYIVNTPVRVSGMFKGYKLKLLINPIETDDTPLRKNRSGETGNGSTGYGKSAPINKEFINIDGIDNSLSNDKEIIDELAKKFAEHNPTQRKKVPAKKESKPALLMRDSIQINIDAVKFALFGTMYEKANIEFYYEAALAWSDSKQQKSKDWLATIRNFMLRDIKDGRLVTGVLSQEEKLTTVNDIMQNWENI